MTVASLETTTCFQCCGETLVGVLHHGAPGAQYGLIIVVGGPQYRVGSHRQFVLLGRALASAGIPVLRFDVRGMGDSSGIFAGFEHINDDIAAAVGFIRTAIPDLNGVLLWGLCDAASAIMFYAHTDPRVHGIALVNPWVRTEMTHARTQIRRYYGPKLVSINFWRRLATGKLNVRGTTAEMLSIVRRALSHTSLKDPSHSAQCELPLPERMAAGLEAFKGDVLLILSGNDLTAREFADVTSASVRWRGLLSRSRVTRHELPEADHTFSRAASSATVVGHTLDWVRRHQKSGLHSRQANASRA